MKRIIFPILSLVIGVACLSSVIYYVGLDTLFKAIRTLSLWKFLLASIPLFIAFNFTCVRWRLLIRSKYKDKKFGFYDAYVSKLFDSAISYITPTAYVGGEPVRGYYVSKKLNIPFEEALSAAIVDKLVEMIGYIILMVIGLFALIVHFALPKNLETIFFCLVLFFFFFLYFLYQRIVQRKLLISRAIEVLKFDEMSFFKTLKIRIAKIENYIVNFFHDHNEVFLQMVALTLLSRVFLVLSYWMVVYFLGIHISLIRIFAITTLIILSYMFPIPGSLGTFEAAVTFGFALLGLNLEIGLLFGLMVRGFSVVAVVAGLTVLFHYFSRDALRGIFKGVR